MTKTGIKRIAVLLIAALTIAMLAACSSGGNTEEATTEGSGGSYSDLMIVPGLDLAAEEYAIAFRVGSDAALEVNDIIAELNDDGTLASIAEKYDLGSTLMSNDAMQLSFVGMDRIESGDLDYIKANGTLKIGITIFAPMNYYDEDGKLIGFDTEFAEAVCAKLGVTPEFIEINWDTKEVELAAKNIDCIWNGLTVTEERRANMEFTYSYIFNKQVVVIRTADADVYKTISDLAEAKLTAEISSAGESAIMDDDVLSGATYTAMQKQTDTLLEVKAGTADAAVLDYTAAMSLVG
jgi:ABC-type amino acid transport/signal transduction systems, periplasmic component/domain